MSGIRLIELGPRDGLQNEAVELTVEQKIALIDGLISAGLKVIETGAFVPPKWVPQMAGSDRIAAHYANHPVEMPVLVPNLNGLDRAIAAGASTIAVFAATTESFARANLNASRAESFARFSEVIAKARAHGLAVRGYVSCAIHCPFEGWVAPGIAAELAAELASLGCYEISLCDTTGAGTPDRSAALLRATADVIPLSKVAVHFHDTFGQALANAVTALDLGVTAFDSAVAGLGGCPYSPGASGNLATEDLVYALEAQGHATGVDLEALAILGAKVSALLGRHTQSRAGRAILARDRLAA